MKKINTEEFELLDLIGDYYYFLTPENDVVRICDQNNIYKAKTFYGSDAEQIISTFESDEFENCEDKSLFLDNLIDDFNYGL